MITKFDPRTARDFRQQFEGTIGWVIPESKRELMVYVENVNDRRVLVRDVNGFDYSIVGDADLSFRFQQVDAGWYPYKNTAAYMWRVPARQWSRGVNSNNTRINYMDESGRFGELSPDIATMTEMYSGAKVPGLIDKHFYISPQGVLYLHRDSIGKFNKNTGTIILDSNIFMQEINDIIRRNSLSYKVAHV